ncbi:MAG: iron-containing redox enzyme family protein [Cyanobacteria bacterium P01_G01_bin.19]
MASEANNSPAKQQVDGRGLVSEGSEKLEWAQIALGKVVVANSERAWLYQPQSPEDRFARPMECAGSFATTKKLLDTAIAAAKVAVKSDSRPPALTATRWVWRLAGAYHLTSPVPRLLKDAAIGFAAGNRSDLKSWALEKVEEETGHDRLALLDIQSLGYDAKAVVEEFKPPAAIALMDYFTRSVQDDDPIDGVGYTYTMERLSLGVEQDYIQKVESLFPDHINATRCLRVHSAVGADAGHVDENVALIAELSASERTRIARACYETALMLFSPPPGGYISDAELQAKLEPLKIGK